MKIYPRCNDCRFRVYCSDRRKSLAFENWYCKEFTPSRSDYVTKRYCSECTWKKHCMDKHSRNFYGCPDYENWHDRVSGNSALSFWDKYASERGY